MIEKCYFQTLYCSKKINGKNVIPDSKYVTFRYNYFLCDGIKWSIFLAYKSLLILKPRSENKIIPSGKIRNAGKYTFSYTEYLMTYFQDPWVQITPLSVI